MTWQDFLINRVKIQYKISVKPESDVDRRISRYQTGHGSPSSSLTSSFTKGITPRTIYTEDTNRPTCTFKRKCYDYFMKTGKHCVYRWPTNCVGKDRWYTRYTIDTSIFDHQLFHQNNNNVWQRIRRKQKLNKKPRDLCLCTFCNYFI